MAEVAPAEGGALQPLIFRQKQQGILAQFGEELLPEGQQINSSEGPREVLENGACQGRNDFNRIGYGGPCPPPGKVHRYFFRLYALDTALNLKAGASRQELERAMKGHVLSHAEWMGTYRR